MTSSQAELAAALLESTVNGMRELPMSAADHETAKLVFAACDAAVAFLRAAASSKEAAKDAEVSLCVSCGEPRPCFCSQL